MNMQNRLHAITRIGGVMLLLGAVPSWANWQLDNEHSQLSFVSVKNTNIAEAHTFGYLNGQIDASGHAQVNIDLASVNTNIDIRNERIVQILFELSQFPTANVSADIDAQALAGLVIGGSVKLNLNAVLSLNGNSIPFTAPVLVTKAGNDKLVVATTQPIVLSALQLGFTAGLEQLREIAVLSSITQAVPISFVITFARSSNVPRSPHATVQ